MSKAKTPQPKNRLAAPQLWSRLPTIMRANRISTFLSIVLLICLMIIQALMSFKSETGLWWWTPEVHTRWPDLRFFLLSKANASSRRSLTLSSGIPVKMKHHSFYKDTKTNTWVHISILHKSLLRHISIHNIPRATTGIRTLCLIANKTTLTTPNHPCSPLVTVLKLFLTIYISFFTQRYQRDRLCELDPRQYLEQPGLEPWAPSPKIPR